MMKNKPEILVCDDDEAQVEIVSALAEHAGFQPRKCLSAEDAMFSITEAGWPNFAILDVEMPGENGLDLCARLTKLRPALPVIIMTANLGPQYETKAFAAGAVDFINKPFAAASLVSRIKAHWANREHKTRLEEHEKSLEAEVAEKTLSLRALQEITIFALTTLCGERDQETGSHILRTQLFAETLAIRLKNKFPELSDSKIAAIHQYAPLHDIGKIGIPDRILLKPGKLTEAEFEVIKTHPTIGHKALKEAEKHTSLEIMELGTAKRIILYHHEKWDGSGYPYGLKGEEIPIEARIMAIADVYDALRARRVYKEPMAHLKAVGIILEGRSIHFDPDAVDAFIAEEAKFETIAETYEASETELELARKKVERL